LVHSLRTGTLFNFYRRNLACNQDSSGAPAKKLIRKTKLESETHSSRPPQKPIRKTKLKSEMFMKIRILAIMAALLAGAGFSRADIISNTIAADGDGVMTCYVYPLIQTGPGNFQLNIDGTHNSWNVGHIQGAIITDTPTDPTLALFNSIDNDTGFTWGDYHVQVTMSKPFTFSNVGVGNGGWTFNTTAPVLVGSDWIGYINYFAGTPVLVGGTLDFNYSMTFTGGASFQEALTPSPVPEPGTFALMVCGLTGLLVMRRRSAMKSAG
jgi:hypothetical protein